MAIMVDKGFLISDVVRYKVYPSPLSTKKEEDACPGCPPETEDSTSTSARWKGDKESEGEQA